MSRGFRRLGSIFTPSCHEPGSLDGMKRRKGRKGRKSILLIGNPNVGKSVIFNRLTGVDVIVSNYPGTTVDFHQGKLKLKKESVDLIDVPGIYSFEAQSPADKVAVELLDAGDAAINVLDSTNLERNLYLTLELLERGIPVVVALNMWDEANHQGIRIDASNLSKELGVPAVPTVALVGKGLNDLVHELEDEMDCSREVHPERTPDERWSEVGRIVSIVARMRHKHHTLRDRLEELTIHPSTGIPFALLALLAVFAGIILVGNFMVDDVLTGPFLIYNDAVVDAVQDWSLPSQLEFLLVGDGGDPLESFGILTTGLYVPLVIVLPFIFLFYLTLSTLEDIGFLPRLAILTDSVMHRFGIHGQGVITVILGLGCNVPGVMSGRVMETSKQRFISITLMAIAVPCMAQTAMVFALLGRYTIWHIVLVYLILATIYIVVGVILNKIMPGESPEILMEIPPYHIPSWTAVLKKTWVRVKHFVKDAVPFMILGVAIINILYVIGAISVLGDAMAPIIVGVFGLPKETAAVLIIGFLRKDVAVGMLIPMGLNAGQMVIAAVILTIYFPCIATFTLMVRELKAKGTAMATAVMLTVVITVGALMNLVLGMFS